MTSIYVNLINNLKNPAKMCDEFKNDSEIRVEEDYSLVTEFKLFVIENYLPAEVISGNVKEWLLLLSLRNPRVFNSICESFMLRNHVKSGNRLF